MEKYDKYGILKLNKTTGTEWFNKWDNDKSRILGAETEVDPYDSNFRVTIGKPDYPCYMRLSMLHKRRWCLKIKKCRAFKFCQVMGRRSMA
jgi:hypothetical protein